MENLLYRQNYRLINDVLGGAKVAKLSCTDLYAIFDYRKHANKIIETTVITIL
jgi:hypothetical protein